MAIKRCVDKFIPVEVGAAIAARENPENRPSTAQIKEALSTWVGNTTLDLRGAGVILTGRKWPNGKTIRITFMDGPPETRRRIRETAEKWLPYVHLFFEWVDDPNTSDVRITTMEEGSWSHLGTSCLAIPKTEATMCFGWLEPDSSQTEYDRVVLHEFGHMFGYPHEHQHPKHTIPYDKPAVYAYYQRTNGWDQETVDEQVFARYSETVTQFSEFDTESIMLYAIPNELTIGDFYVGWNTSISAGDAAFAQWQYPKPVTPPEPPRPVERKKMRKQTFEDARAAFLENKRLELTYLGKTFGYFDGIKTLERDTERDTERDVE